MCAAPAACTRPLLTRVLSARHVPPPLPFPAVGLPKDVDYSRFFFGYVCKKRRLQLSSHPEQRQRLPQGWVRSSRALVAK